MTVTGPEKVNVIYVNDKLLELVQLLSKSTCWIETIFLRGEEVGSWLLIGVLTVLMTVELSYTSTPVNRDSYYITILLRPRRYCFRQCPFVCLLAGLREQFSSENLVRLRITAIGIRNRLHPYSLIVSITLSRLCDTRVRRSSPFLGLKPAVS